MQKNTVFILAAGFGTRLRPLTLHRPKPLLPLLGKPMIDHAVEWLQQHGHEHIMVNAHHLWEQIAEWAHQRGIELQVELPSILGTGGGLKAAEDRLAQRFLVWNGDIVCDINPNQLLDSLGEKGAAMALRHSDKLGTTTPLSIDSDGNVDKIGSLVQTPTAPIWDSKPSSGFHFTGIHAMNRESLKHIPFEPDLRCVVRTAYVSLVPIYGVNAMLHTGFWRDAGTPQEYLQANLDALSGRLPMSRAAWENSSWKSRDNWVHKNATVEGKITQSIVGKNAHVSHRSSLVNCVVWDNAVVPEGEHTRCIFHDGGKLQVDSA